ncbi:unnamed protein product [Moneuplotes crassus]|uniref:Cyclic nucleotide-binding domain-containing protein n=1 Tax=Euplotes crassus TaxID=5936 RepID=A0AAD1U659_EUPCR|nr:unnamed protein product [Moneuplotes crassus]
MEKLNRSAISKQKKYHGEEKNIKSEDIITVETGSSFQDESQSHQDTDSKSISPNKDSGKVKKSKKNFHLVFKNKLLFHKLKKKLKGMPGTRNNNISFQTNDFPEYSTKKTVKLKFSEETISSSRKIFKRKIEIQQSPREEPLANLSINQGYLSARKMIKLPQLDKVTIDLSQIPNINGFSPRNIRQATRSQKRRRKEQTESVNIETPNTSRSLFNVFQSSKRSRGASFEQHNHSFVSHLDRRFDKLKGYAAKLHTPSLTPSQAQQLKEWGKMLKKEAKEKRRNSKNSNHINNTRNLPSVDLSSLRTKSFRNQNNRSKLEDYKQAKPIDYEDLSARSPREIMKLSSRKRLVLPSVSGDNIMRSTGSFRQSGSFRRENKSGMKTPGQNIRLKNTKEEPEPEISTKDFNLFEAVNKANSNSDDSKQQKDYQLINQFIQKLIQEKLGLEKVEDKLAKILDSISTTMTTKVVFKDDPLFSKNGDISGVYLLLDGKIGINRPNSSTKNSKKASPAKTKDSASQEKSQVIQDKYTFVCEMEVLKGGKYKQTAVGLQFPFSRFVHIPRKHYQSMLAQIWASSPHLKGKCISGKSALT